MGQSKDKKPVEPMADTGMYKGYSIKWLRQLREEGEPHPTADALIEEYEAMVHVEEEEEEEEVLETVDVEATEGEADPVDDDNEDDDDDEEDAESVEE